MPRSSFSSAFRFSLTQLLLITTLCCLLLALAVAIKDRVAGSYEPQLLSISPDGNSVAAGFEGGLVRVWNLPRREQIKRFEVPDQYSIGLFGLLGISPPVSAMRFDSTGESLFVAGRYMEITSWPLSEDQPPTPIALSQPTGYLTGDFAPDAKLLAAAPWGATYVELWDLESGSQKAVLNISTGTPFVSSITFSRDGRRLFAAFDDGTVEVWDPSQGAPPPPPPAPAQPASSSDLAEKAESEPAKDRAIEGDSVLGESLAQFQTNISFGRLAASPDGAMVAITDPYDEDDAIELWDVSTGKSKGILPSGNNEVTSFEFSPDGNGLAVGYSDGSVTIWNTKTAALRGNLDPSGGGAACVAYLPDGAQLIVGNYGSIDLIDTNSLQVVQTLWEDTPHVYIYLFAPAFIVWAIAWGFGNRRAESAADAVTNAMEIAPSGIESFKPAEVASWPRVVLTLILAAFVLALPIMYLVRRWLVGGTLSSYILAFLLILIAVPLLIFAVAFVFHIVRLLMRKNHRHQLKRARQCSGHNGSTLKLATINAWFESAGQLHEQFSSQFEVIRERYHELYDVRPSIEMPTLALSFSQDAAFVEFMGARWPIAGYYTSFKRNPQLVLCEETAVRRLSEPTSILQSLFGYALLHNHKKFFPIPWLNSAVSSALVEPALPGESDRMYRRIQAAIASDQILPAATFFGMGARALTRHIMRHRTFERYRTYLTFATQAYCLGDWLVDERRERFARFLGALNKKDDYEAVLRETLGCGYDKLWHDWKSSVVDRTLGPHMAPTPKIRNMIENVHVPRIKDVSAAIRDRVDAIRTLAAGGFAVGADSLIEALTDAFPRVRSEAHWALCAIAGTDFGTDSVAWQRWWSELPAEINKPATTPDEAVEAILVDETSDASLATLANSPQNAPSPSAKRGPSPRMLRTCWTISAIGGVVAICWSMCLLFLGTRVLVFLPPVYFGLWLGSRAISRAVARRADGLNATFSMQLINLMVCDAVNFSLGLFGIKYLRARKRSRQS